MTYPQSDSDLIDRVKGIMQYHKGYLQRIDRDELTRRIFGKVTDSLDRKVRDALSEISTVDMPIVWQDGYFVPLREQEAQQYRAGLQSRRAVLRQREQVLDDWFRRRREREPVKQLELLEVV